MALSSTDPRVLMGQAKCFSCLTPHQQYILRTYLLALIAMGDTSITGVQALSSASTCFACLTYEELLAAKQYLMAVWLGLDTSKAGIIAQAAAAACDFACLTPKQAEQLRTYLLAVTAGFSTTAAGVRTLEAAAKCFNCLESKQQLEAQVYLLSTLAPGAPTTPAAIMQGAKCYLACVPPELHEALQTSLFAQVTSRSTPPCVTPTAPSQPTVVTATTNLIKIAWTQPANSGSLITSYTISWGTATGVYTNSATVSAGIKSYTITGLSQATAYFFVVKANAFTGCSSANSTEQTATTGGQPADPLLVGILAYWRMEEASNATRLDSIGANNMLDVNSNIPLNASGIIGNGLGNPTNAAKWLRIAANASGIFALGVGKEFTATIWVHGMVNPGTFFTHRATNAATTNWKLSFDGIEFILEVTDAALNAANVASAHFTMGSFWNFIACGVDLTANVIWIESNGFARVTTPILGGGLAEANSGISIGACYDGTANWFGANDTADFGNTPCIDEVGIWGRSLTHAEVLTLYNGGAGARP